MSGPSGSGASRGGGADDRGRRGSSAAPRLPLALLALALLAVAAAGLVLVRSGTEAEAPAPPRGLDYVPPAPGSYTLPPIQQAADGEVVTADGTPHRLFDYLGDRYALLSFVYTRCSDGRGCPFATATFQMVRRRLEQEPEVARRVRFITLSFDPGTDTPEVMRRFGRAAGAEPGEDDSWVFLTTDSRDELDALLDGYGQYIVPDTDEEGRFLGTFTHVLKVYLIDRERRVRNIYSTSFLHPELVLNDLETLLLEQEKAG